MKVIRAPLSLMLSSAALFILVPIAVLTAAVFSEHVWWDLPIHRLQLAGFFALFVVTPVSWRLSMGRRGGWEALATVCLLTSCFLLSKAIWIRGTLQAVWAVVVTGLFAALLAWTRYEQKKSYFDPKMRWYQGLPVPIPGLKAMVSSGSECEPRELSVCRLDSRGLFGFSRSGSIVPGTEVSVELRHGGLHDERKARITGSVVRQFERRSSAYASEDWGIGVRFYSLRPDEAKDFRDFLEVLRGEGFIGD